MRYRTYNNYNPKLTKLFYIIPLIVSIVFFIVGIATLYNRAVLEKRCTDMVRGEIVRNEVRSSTDSDGHTSTGYAPVYAYTYNGRAYEVVSSTSSNPPAFQPGDTTEIWVDHDEPTKIFVPEDNTSKVLGIVFTAVGGFLLAVSLTVMVMLALRKRQNGGSDTYDMRYNGDDMNSYYRY